MKTPEQFLREVIKYFPDDYVIDTPDEGISIHSIIKAMEEYAIQSVECAKDSIEKIKDDEHERDMEYAVQLLQSWVHDHGPHNETINFVQAYWNKHNIFPYEP